MTRIKIENEVLKNMILCIREQLSILEASENYTDDCFWTIGAITSIANSFEDELEFSLILGKVVDYRHNKNFTGNEVKKNG